ncbi:MAG: FAD-dependent oxidoreductase [Deltaproteobacteria bacterium]|nr:FAD-dependent oxidoreductase [Deltaproteobacteria bacterium]
MERLFEQFSLGSLNMENRFFFPPIKLGYGSPDGKVTGRQIRFYKQIAKNGPAVVILEPVSVTPDGREHPKQLCVHLSKSVTELRMIVEVIHKQDRLACLHLNHAGAAANPKVTGARPKAPSIMTCARSAEESEPLSSDEIAAILEGYKTAAQKAEEAGFDLIEIQAGHGYLVSQFLNRKINKRNDSYGQDRLLFAKEVFSSVKKGTRQVPFIVRVSGNEMSPEFGIGQEDLLPFLKLAEEAGALAIHVGMGNTCFSPAWYFHQGSLPEKPQKEALAWLRENTSLPLIVAGKMGRKKKIKEVFENGLADLIALGRPLIADPGLIEKWRKGQEESVVYCGYCLQGCLHRVQSGKPLGCNLNPEIGLPPLEQTSNPLNVLVVGGGPAGMSATLYMTRRGHRVTLVEKNDHLGGQFSLAWQAPGKQVMKDGLDGLCCAVEKCGAKILQNNTSYKDISKEIRPDVIVWATGALTKKLETPGLDKQYAITALEYINGEKELRGPRVLVIGAGRVGLEVAEMLGKEGYQVVATKRTDPIGGMMVMINKKLALMRIGQLPNVTLMPHTTVNAFTGEKVEVEQDGQMLSLEPFQTVVLAAGMQSAPEPDQEIKSSISKIEIIGDAKEVQDIYTAVQAGYQLALNH